MLRYAIAVMACGAACDGWAQDGRTPAPVREICAIHRSEQEAIRRGRIEFAVKMSVPEGRLLELYQKRTQAAAQREKDRPAEAGPQPREDADRQAREEAFKDLLDESREVSVIYWFDKDRNAKKAHTRDLRDLPALARRQGLPETCVQNIVTQWVELLNQGKWISYMPDSAYFDLMANPNLGLPCEEWVDDGLWSVAFQENRTAETLPAPEGDGCVRAEIVHGNARTSLLLDPKVGYRIKRRTLLVGGTKRTEDEFEYAVWGEHLFPKSHTRTTYGESGKETQRRTCTYTNVTLNQNLPPDTFTLRMAPGARGYDYNNNRQVRVPEIAALAREAVSLTVDDVLNEALEQAVSPKLDALAERSAPPRPDTAPAPAPRVAQEPRAFPYGLVGALLAVVVILALAVMGWRTFRHGRRQP